MDIIMFQNINIHLLYMDVSIYIIKQYTGIHNTCRSTIQYSTYNSKVSSNVGLSVARWTAVAVSGQAGNTHFGSSSTVT